MTVFHSITAGTLGSHDGTTIDAEVSQEFLDRIPGGLFRYRADESGTIDYVSREVLTMFGCETYEEFSAITGNTFYGMVHPDDRDRVARELVDQIQKGDTDTLRFRLDHPSNKDVWVDDRGHLVVDDMGTAWFYVTLIDISEKVAYQRKLERANERLEILTELSHDILFDIDCQAQTGEIFGDFEGRFGRIPCSDDVILRKRCTKECSIDLEVHDITPLKQIVGRGDFVDIETSLCDLEGNPIWCRYQSYVIFNEDGCPVRHVGRLLDTHEMVMRADRLRRKAEIDGMTGIWNREAAMERIENLLEHMEEGTPFTLFLIDVDDFKQVNDTFGHPQGDEVLKDVAQFLSTTMRKEDVVARLGGDEFAIFAVGLGPGDALNNLLVRLSAGIYSKRAKPETMPDELDPTISIGAAASSGEKMGIDDLYKVADDALYTAKRGGKSQYSMTLTHS